MISIPDNTKIYLCKEYLDFRSGFNGTAAACRLKLSKNPLDGGLFVFINKLHTMIRCYYFDGHGEWMIMKRKATGKFKWITSINIENFEYAHLILILRGADPSKVKLPRPWKEFQ